MKQLILDLIPPPAPTLDNYVAGRNGEALSALRDAASAFPPAKILYLWGAASSGKSHLAQSFPDAANAAGFFAEHAGVLPETANHFVIDDVHAADEGSQIGVFNLINLINASPAKHVLIATGNAAPRDLAIRRDLASRLGQGLVFQLHPLSDNEKSAALQAHAHTRGFALRDEVVAYLLRHSRRAIHREQEGTKTPWLAGRPRRGWRWLRRISCDRSVNPGASRRRPSRAGRRELN